MLIACLGWGSLVWDPRDLPLRGKWFCDGPFLPIEFARQSMNGRMTLVIVPNTFPLVRSLWSPMSVSNLAEARNALGQRECEHQEKPASCVDYWPRRSKYTCVAHKIGQWARALQIDAVVWTNLMPKFNDQDKKLPTEQGVLTYLRALQGNGRDKAEEYIRRTPRQIDTPYRRAIETHLGWSCASLSSEPEMS
jgi:hypothetical protein